MSLFEKVVDAVIAEHPAVERPGDYRDEQGMLRCGVCGQRKEMLLEAEGFPSRIVPVICKCELDRIDRERVQEAARKAAERIDNLRKLGLSDPLYEAYSFAHDDRRDEKASDVARRYAAGFQDFLRNNIGLMFYGEVGVGKSFLAGCIANALIDKGIFALMSTIQGLVAEAGKKYGENRDAVIRYVQDADLLILDDFGVERDTEYMAEQCYEIINARYKAQKPLIVTTNLSPAAMARENELSKRRIYERVMEMCQTVRVEGSSRRMGIAKDKAKLARELLGLEGKP